jgi:eukaryotic-like serine/threonine-protein kinase
MNTGTAVRRFRTFAGKGEGARRREKMPVHTGDPSESQAPTRVGGARGRGDASTRVASQGETIGGAARGQDGPIVLDRYRLRRRLGTGGFATVWRARDERLDRDVAIKILPRERVVGGRFEREARAAARLAHPGIVTLYEAAVDDEGAYLVSELVHGTTLDRLLGAGRLSDRDVVLIGIALCDALAHAHANGVIHRDVKPSNVLVPNRPTSEAGLARLTDFGVARVVGGDALTMTGDVIGTAAYMAPEQAQGLPAGAPADLFSLALVLYEGLTGVNPVRTGAAGAYGRRLGMHLPPLRRQRRELPRELGQAIDLALRPRPSERGRLDDLKASLTAAAARVGDEPGVVAEPWRPRTSTRRAAADEDQLRVEDRRARTAERSLVTQKGDQDPGREREKTHIPWPRRALAGAAAAALSVWLARHAPGSSPVPAAATACLAGLLVAAFPRAGWIGLTAFMATGLVIHSHAGAALILVAAALVPVVLAPRDGPAWPLSAGAPALGAIGLAGAWPAAAGLAGSAWRRAVVALTGWLWLVVVRAPWTESVSNATHHTLVPILTTSTLIGGAVWAAAAVVLPWAQVRRSPVLECVLLTTWAVALGLATSAVASLGPGPRISTAAALGGAFAGAIVALVIRQGGRRLASARWAKDCTPTA